MKESRIKLDPIEFMELTDILYTGEKSKLAISIVLEGKQSD